jgi:ATP-dependent DNA ligase
MLRNSRGGIQYVEHTEGDGDKMFAAVCKLGLEGIVSKKKVISAERQAQPPSSPAVSEA